MRPGRGCNARTAQRTRSDFWRGLGMRDSEGNLKYLAAAHYRGKQTGDQALLAH